MLKLNKKNKTVTIAEPEVTDQAELSRQSSLLLMTIASRAKQIVTLVILCVVLGAAVSGLVASLFKSGHTGSTLDESLKILSAINNFHQMPGVLGAIQFNASFADHNHTKWNETIN